MNEKTYISIDNGATGAIGIISPGLSPELIPTPTFKEQNYTKKKGNITRIDTIKIEEILKPYVEKQCFLFVERPLVNPGRFKATISAVRALEATLIIIEKLKLPYQYVDSKQWQKAMLPLGLKGPELKSASKDIAIRLFPHLKEVIIKQKDGDAILMAEYCRREKL